MGVEYFGLTMGASGLLLATQREMVFASPPKMGVHNAAGSGDTVMAAIIYAQMRGMTLVEVARWLWRQGRLRWKPKG